MMMEETRDFSFLSHRPSVMNGMNKTFLGRDWEERRELKTGGPAASWRTLYGSDIIFLRSPSFFSKWHSAAVKASRQRKRKRENQFRCEEFLLPFSSHASSFASHHIRKGRRKKKDEGETVRGREMCPPLPSFLAMEFKVIDSHPHLFSLTLQSSEVKSLLERGFFYFLVSSFLTLDLE